MPKEIDAIDAGYRRFTPEIERVSASVSSAAGFA